MLEACIHLLGSKIIPIPEPNLGDIRIRNCSGIGRPILWFWVRRSIAQVCILPSSSIFPGVLPMMALARTLVLPEKKDETIKSWTITRYRFFLLAFVAMFLWFFVPNFLFTALHSFNVMTWIAPRNFPLGMITGFHGGLGSNPLATLDWNVAGKNSLVTPFFSFLQRYIARAVSGLIIIAQYTGETTTGLPIYPSIPTKRLPTTRRSTMFHAFCLKTARSM